MASTNVSLVVTLTSDGSAYRITSNSIVSITENGDGGSDILQDVGQQAPIKIVVDEAPADISSDTDALIEVTVLNASGATLGSQWLNSNFIIEVTAEGTGSNILYSAGQQAPINIIVSESPSSIQTAINALNPTPIGGFVDTTSAQNVAGVKTWEDEGIFEAINSYSAATGITAFAGGGQGSATVLAAEYNNVTTVATAADSVKLPAASVGLNVIVKNNGVAALAVFPATGDTINGGAANASVTVPVGAQFEFRAIDSTDWETDAVVSTSGTQSIAGSKTFTGTVTTNGIVVNAGTPQTLTGAGAVNITTYSTLLVTTGANALTLADGAEGQWKFIKMKTDGGDGTLTPTNLNGYSTITFNDAGDFVMLYFLDAKWNIIQNQGCTLA